MSAPDPCEDFDITQPVATVPIGTASWTHPAEATVISFALVYIVDDVQTVMEPRPKAEFGSGPYEATIAIRDGIEWGVVAINADGVSS